MAHSVWSTLGTHDSARSGSASPSALVVANVSSIDGPIIVPPSVHWSMLGFHPLTSAGTATTSLPPGRAGSSGSNGEPVGVVDVGAVPGPGVGDASDRWPCNVPLQPASAAASTTTTAAEPCQPREVPPDLHLCISHLPMRSRRERSAA